MVDYVTVAEVAHSMNIDYNIPTDVSTQGMLVECTKIDSSTTYYYVGTRNIISSTVELYYGASSISALSNSLTLTTHYTIYNADLGIIALTSAGITLVDDNNLYIKCKAISAGTNGEGLSQTRLQTEIDNVKTIIDSKTNTIFGELSSIDDEYHDGQGTNPYYALKHRPINEILNVYYLSGDNTYTKLDKSYYHIDDDSLFLVLDYIPDCVYNLDLRALKISYDYGYSNVPDDISELALNMVKLNLTKGNVLTNYLRGQSVDNIENTNVFDIQMAKTLAKYENRNYSIAKKKKSTAYTLY